MAALAPCSDNGRILLANLLQSSKSTFSRGSFLSFFAFKEGMLGTPISVFGGWPTVTHESGLSTAYENSGTIFRRVSERFLRDYSQDAPGVRHLAGLAICAPGEA